MMTMVWPSDFSISPATSRVIWSVEPPAAQGTIRLIGRAGFQSAAAGTDRNAAPIAQNTAVICILGYFTRHPPFFHCGEVYGQPADRANHIGSVARRLPERSIAEGARQRGGNAGHESDHQQARQQQSEIADNRLDGLLDRHIADQTRAIE